jgi:signal transduction histidine kinase
MRASAVLVVAAAVACGLAIGLGYGTRPGVLTALLFAGVGAVALAAAHVVAAHRRRLGGLRRQFSFAVAVASGQVLIAAGAAAVFMFVSHHDAAMVAVLALFVTAIAVRAAQLMAGGVMRDVEAVRDGLEAVGAGRRDVDVRTEGDDELAELAGAANRMRDELRAGEDARRDLVAAVSHDLRTPITSLSLLVDAMNDDIVDDATRRTYLARMSPHVHALSSLIDDLFELSRLEAGDIRWEMERVRLDALVGETVGAMRVQAEANGVEVRSDIRDGVAPARANPEKVQRVLFNLIQNAIRHTPPDGSVVVRAEPGGEGVEVEVADTGDGIAPTERDRVFEPFFRGGAETARTRNGAGLGLAISRAIIEAHGGRIWLAESAHGTRVRFSLPKAAG